MKLPLTPIRCLYRGVDLYGKGRRGVGQLPLHVCPIRRALRTPGRRTDRGRHPRRATAWPISASTTISSWKATTASSLAHGIVMPLNVRLTPAELIAILNHAEARMLIFENDFAPLVEHLREACPAIERFVTINETTPAGRLHL